jgi:hypothetical protein
MLPPIETWDENPHAVTVLQYVIRTHCLSAGMCSAQAARKATTRAAVTPLV